MRYADATDEPKVATLDHGHFAPVRPAHVPVLVLVPLRT